MWQAPTHRRSSHLPAVQVAMHFEYLSRPALQIHVIRILWMVPVYAVDAWLALRFPVRGCDCGPA